MQTRVYSAVLLTAAMTAPALVVRADESDVNRAIAAAGAAVGAARGAARAVEADQKRLAELQRKLQDALAALGRAQQRLEAAQDAYDMDPTEENRKALAAAQEAVAAAEGRVKGLQDAIAELQAKWAADQQAKAAAIAAAQAAIAEAQRLADAEGTNKPRDKARWDAAIERLRQALAAIR